ncbi:hypothetical protein GPL17_18770 [Bradyrhizobium yuanmingense]|uniref:hypothetical protein n=1 Tax=Bradyrhizobium yuanmingense TaxID=108015 RepID=UPI0012F8481A|nr:hypothetical protein [Bradyrhizobium yuanmingense]MVT52527.1 hypothetical protein [Bradyrhizobium yuanmingense]
MATFELEAGGKTYEIEAPDQATAVSAFQRMNGRSGQSQAPQRASMPVYDGMGNTTGYSEGVDVPQIAPSALRNQLDDIVKGAGGGLVRGTAGAVGLITDTVPSWLAGTLDWAEAKARGETPEQAQARVAHKRANNPLRQFSPTLADAARTVGQHLTTKGLQDDIATVTGPAYVPTTRAGKFASSAAEFVPGSLIGSSWANAGRNALLYGVVPGLTSEGAGQVFEGGPLETPARIAGGFMGGVGSALASRSGSAVNMVRDAVGNITPQQLDAAEQLFQRAQAAGQPISRAEAVQAVTNGSTNIGDLQHTVEGMGGLREFYSQRPAQNEAAARRVFDTVSPQAVDPSQVGPTVSRIAQQAMRESPEGSILADTLYQAGPRVSPEQAGSTMQQELRSVYDRREGMRSALADQDYGAARNTRVPVPVDGVVGFIDRELRTAKGDTARALRQARETMFRPDGAPDTSVAGLHNAREAISDLISQAERAGNNNMARELGGTLSRLDDALERVPAYGQARRNFARASEPLDAFGENRAPGQIIESDHYGRRNLMPADRAPRVVQQGGPEAARDFNSVATPAAREAFEQHLTTQVLDKATREGADLSADSIRTALRQNEDLLRQYPGVRDRLESVAIAREGLARLESTPIGRLAQRDQTTQKAVATLFPENPLPGSQHEISDAIGTLAERNPWAARQLVRTHAESLFNEATQRLASGGPNQSGGAKFAAKLRGNTQQNANLQAAVEALPNGETTWRGFNAFLDNLEAQQFRQATGSRTAFKIPGVENLKSGGAANTAAQLVASGGFNWPKKAAGAIEQWNVGRNLDDLARLLTDPAAANEFRAIASAPSGSNKALAITARLAIVAANGRNGADRPRIYVSPVR